MNAKGFKTLRSQEQQDVSATGVWQEGSWRVVFSRPLFTGDENDVQIKATDRQARPVSMRVTCGKCHDYDTIASGWHFHSGTTNVLSGRLGEPWVLTDNRIRTQIPISDRGWKGTYNPSDVDLTAWKHMVVGSICAA